MEPSPGGRVNGIHLGSRPNSEAVIAPILDGATVVIVELASDGLTTTQQHGLAPTLDVTLVSGVVGDLVGDHDHAATRWSRAEALGRLALAHYIAGALRTMFELARDHAAERVQFGRPVGTFQALRHKLADAFVAVEALDAAAAAAWDADDPFLAAATAKVVASKSVGIVAANSQQVLAGVGFTAEHPFHPHLKRAVVLDRILGGGPRLAAEVGRRVVGHGEAPRLVEL